MPSSALIHAAVFTVGAVVGAGTAVTITRRRQQHLAPTLSSANVNLAAPTSVVESKKPGIASAVEIKSISAGGVLKYGNPGQS